MTTTTLRCALSQRAIDALPSPTLAITAKANAMKAQGLDVVGFAAGEPDFDTPGNIKDAAVKALAGGDTKYTASSGTAALKNAIIEKLKTDNGIEYKPNEIIVSCGAKHSIFNALQAMLDPGDEVIITSPYWVSYPEQVKLADGVPVIVETTDRTGFLASAEVIERHITSRTKMLIMNSPSNPTGAVYTPQAMREISDLCVRRGIYILSDEIYEKILYRGSSFVSPASFSDEAKRLTLTVNGFSKSYAMTGWRLGYAAADAEIVSAMSRIQDQSTSNPVSFAQAGAVAALTGPQDTVETMRLAFEERRDRIVSLLNDIPGVSCPMPGGAFYVFPNVSSLYGKRWTTESGEERVVTGSDSMAEFLLTTKQVAVVPGSGFGADAHIRLSYATSMANIEKGLARIAEAIPALK